MRRLTIIAPVLLVLPLLLGLSWPSPSVYLVDQTGGGWPLKRMAAKWGSESALDIHVVSSCPVGETQCIPVTSRTLPGSEAGLTYLTPMDGDIISVKIVLDSTWRGADWRIRRSITCHEMGHAIGLVRHRRHGCMAAEVGPWWPGRRAMARVEALYGP